MFLLNQFIWYLCKRNKEHFIPLKTLLNIKSHINLKCGFDTNKDITLMSQHILVIKFNKNGTVSS